MKQGFTLIVFIFLLLGAQAEAKKQKSVRKNRIGIQVNTADQLIRVIDSDRALKLNSGDYVLSDVRDTRMAHVRWDKVFDGKSITIRNVKNMTITGCMEKPTRLLVKPRYAFVLNFEDCENIILENLVLGHSPDKGTCTSGVLGAVNCKNLVLRNCTLFGCGTEGLTLNKVQDMRFENSCIKDCTYGIMTLTGSETLRFVKSVFTRNEKFWGVKISDSKDIRFEECKFIRNQAENELFHAVSAADVFAKKCTFTDNRVKAMTNNPDAVTVQQPDEKLKALIDAQIEKLKASGAPTTYRELFKEKISDSKNGYVLFQKAMKRYDRYSEKNSSVIEHFPVSGYKEKWENKSVEDRKKLSRVILNHPEFKKIYQMLDTSLEMEFQVLNSPDFTDMESGLKKMMDSSKGFRQAARLFVDRAFALAEDGQMDEAMISCRGAFRLAGKMSCSSLINYLVKVAIYDMLRYSRILLKKGEARMEIYQRIIKDIEEWKQQDELRPALTGERVFLIRQLSTIHITSCKEKLQAIELNAAFSEKKTTEIQDIESLSERELNRLLVQSFVCKPLQALETLIPITSKPYWTIQKDLSAMKKSEANESSFESNCMSLYAATFEFYARRRARMLVIQAALGCHVYKKVHGRYPNTLKVLVPSILKKLDPDPFTGKPLIYKRKGNGFQLYSVGPDGRDNGGQDLWDDSRKDEYDIGWKEQGSAE